MGETGVIVRKVNTAAARLLSASEKIRGAADSVEASLRDVTCVSPLTGKPDEWRETAEHLDAVVWALTRVQADAMKRGLREGLSTPLLRLCRRLKGRVLHEMEDAGRILSAMQEAVVSPAERPGDDGHMPEQ